MYWSYHWSENIKVGLIRQFFVHDWQGIKVKLALMLFNYKGKNKTGSRKNMALKFPIHILIY